MVVSGKLSAYRCMDRIVSSVMRHMAAPSHKTGLSDRYEEASAPLLLSVRQATTLNNSRWLTISSVSILLA